MEDFIRSIVNSFCSFANPEFIIFIISMIPVLELRGGLIAASLLGVDWHLAMIICIIGNVIPVPFILLFMKKIFDFMKKTRLSPIFDKLQNKANKSSEKIFKYKSYGLYLFVAIPFPGTGAWTGSIVSSLFGMNLKNSFFSILLGILTAGVIMSLFSYGLLGAFLR